MRAKPDPRSAELCKSCLWLIALGIVSILLGAFAIFSPLVAGLTVGVLVGFALLIHGAVHVVHSLKARAWKAGPPHAWGGILSLICGGLMVLFPGAALGALTLLLAAFFLMAGSLRIGLALTLRPLRGWGWTLLVGILALGLGVLIAAQWPLSDAWAIGTLVGIKILLDGWAMLLLGLAARNLMKSATAPGPAPQTA